MIVLRDEKRIARLGRLAQVMSMAGLAVLVAGLLLIFVSNNPNVFLFQLLALVIGYAFSQVGLHYAHRYLRRPRMDQKLDEAVGAVARRDGRLYHYLLPAPHVLLLPSGVFVLVAKFQNGRITAEGDTWRQTGLGMRRFFGRENLGNPSREAGAQLAKMQAFIAANAPAATEAPLWPVIVFTADKIDSLEIKESRIPAVHASKLSKVLRQQTINQKPLPRDQYDALRDAFDAAAGHLMEERIETGE
jgi:hypothetical protein